MTLNRRRVAAWLWIVWAFVAWNLVFDLVIIKAGRDYVDLAGATAASSGPYVKIDDTMRPARSRALWLATASAGLILVVGFVAVISTGHPRKT